MSKATRPIPAGHEGLIPHLVCDPCADAIQFYKRAFGAEEVHRVSAPDGRRRYGPVPAQDMFWGDRYGVVTDPFGHNWSFATHLKDLTPAELQATMKEAFAQRAQGV
jgi:uncharacterized glyoxalase superfamily protein PhnB